MENIIVHCFVTCKPGTGAAAAKAINDTGVLPATRKEDGCLHYEMFTSIEDPDRLAFMEIWENEAKIAVHKEGAGLKLVNETLAPFVANVDLKKYLP